MANTDAFLELLTTCGLALLGPDTRPGVLAAPQLNGRLETLFEADATPSAARPLVRALVLLWHDHLDAAHTIVQRIENRDGSLVHAMMHRREPDYWNSKYWWRRVDQHPCFPALSKRVGDYLKEKGDSDLAAKLLPAGKWDAFAFVDACEATADVETHPERLQLLREVQRVEFETALEHFVVKA